MSKKNKRHKKLGLLLGGLGLALTLGGAHIVSLGSSYYFLFVGLMITCSGILINRGLKFGVYLYVLTVLLMLLWSIDEVGYDSQQLITRMGMATAILAYIFFSKLNKELK